MPVVPPSAVVPNVPRAARGGSTRIGWALLAGLLLTGCGYTVGSPFGPEIRSVYVPIFTSEADRRGFEFQLTEAVQKQIQKQTALRVVQEPFADTRLIGKIREIRKNVLGETQFDDPRELQLTIVIDVTWEDIRSGDILAERSFSMTQQEVQFLAQAEFAPEIGQSLATATQQALDRVARDIANMMEPPW